MMNSGTQGSYSALNFDSNSNATANNTQPREPFQEKTNTLTNQIIGADEAK